MIKESRLMGKNDMASRCKNAPVSCHFLPSFNTGQCHLSHFPSYVNTLYPASIAILQFIL